MRGRCYEQRVFFRRFSGGGGRFVGVLTVWLGLSPWLACRLPLLRPRRLCFCRYDVGATAAAAVRRAIAAKLVARPSALREVHIGGFSR